MRLVDLLRSRLNAAESGTGSPGTGFLREQDVEVLYNANTAGGNKTAGSESGKTAPAQKPVAGTGESVDSGFSPMEAGTRLEEWPDDPIEGHIAKSELIEADNVHGEVLAGTRAGVR